MTPVRLEPVAPRSQVTHSTTEPLRSQFVSKIKLKSEPNLRISCKGTDIEPKESVKYLGAIRTMSQW